MRIYHIKQKIRKRKYTAIGSNIELLLEATNIEEFSELSQLTTITDMLKH